VDGACRAFDSFLRDEKVPCWFREIPSKFVVTTCCQNYVPTTFKHGSRYPVITDPGKLETSYWLGRMVGRALHHNYCPQYYDPERRKQVPLLDKTTLTVEHLVSLLYLRMKGFAISIEKFQTDPWFTEHSDTIKYADFIQEQSGLLVNERLLQSRVQPHIAIPELYDLHRYQDLAPEKLFTTQFEEVSVGLELLTRGEEEPALSWKKHLPRFIFDAPQKVSERAARILYEL